MLSRVLTYLSPGGVNGKLSVFIFHRVMAEPDPLFPEEMHSQRFVSVCQWIQRWFNVMPLDMAIQALKAGTLPNRAAALSFDDGYADNYVEALPILKKLGLPCTFFIATGFLDGGRMWNDTVIETVRRTEQAVLDFSPLGFGTHAVADIAQKRLSIAKLIAAIKYLPYAERLEITDRMATIGAAALPTDLMMKSVDVVAMRRAGMQIGAHTVTHPILAKLGRQEAENEIGQSKHYLENLLGERIGLFAYPNGKPGSDYTARDARLVEKMGFDAAFSTAWGYADRSTDPMQMPRFTPWDRSRTTFGIRLARNLIPNASTRAGQMAA